jgi:hypothetical protein
MTGAFGADPRTGEVGRRSRTLVWIDAREAVIVRWQEDRARVDRVESDVPPHRRATGHVRHDPSVRHGGGGSPQVAGEPRRLEHLQRFVEQIAERIPAEDDLLILGPGTVCERLERLVTDGDEHHGHHRTVTCEASSRRTDRQLIERLWRLAGIEPRRRTVGAYRWSEPPPDGPSARDEVLPRRVFEKRPRRAGRGEP